MANTGVIGAINMDHRPSARSAYMQQVQRIAPVELVGRELELRELAAFCTAAGANQGYLWWRAEAWAGKSALMSWFVLYPPTGVRLVSFFITARWAGQSDRVAFTDVVMEQLAELLGEPMPAHLTEATRDQCFLDLLTRAAEGCHAREERLILLVDGLDEDRGVTVGPDAHSIAALLPTRPPAGMRIVLAGRPNPPIPADVPDGHPLRDREIVRRLSRSSQAAVVRQDMLRELSQLLADSQPEQDPLGLVTAAGGGLSAPDLAELTGWPEWQATDHLATVAGRSFTPRASRWQPDTGPAVYVLGHEELQHTAAHRLGRERLDGYRQRLHWWAEGYKHRRWPAETPEYLLRGYYRMLHETGDLPRIIACATDPDRHDRMLDLTGGDMAAIAETTAAQDAILACGDPDLAAMARVAVHHVALTRRNTEMPFVIPAVWARLGRHARAEALVDSITDATHRDRAREAVAEALAEAGYFDQAEAITSSIVDPSVQTQALGAIASTAANAGDRDRAQAVVDQIEIIARSINEPYRRVGATAAAVKASADAGDLGRARALARQVVLIARSITEPPRQLHASAGAPRAATQADDHDDDDQVETNEILIIDLHGQSEALAKAVRALADAGLIHHAESLARSIARQFWSMWALNAVAKAAAHAGDLDRARLLADQVETFALAITDPDIRPWLLTELAETHVAIGDVDRVGVLADQEENNAQSTTDRYKLGRQLSCAAELMAYAGRLGRADDIARSIPYPEQQAEALGAVASAAAHAGDLDHAAALADRAEALARSIDPSLQTQALGAVASAAAHAGDLDQARALADRAEAIARSIASPDEAAFALSDAALAIAASGHAGDLDRAEDIARSIVDSYAREEALAKIAQEAIGAGDLNRAEALARSIIYRPSWTAYALSDVARAASRGDLDRARILAGQIEATAQSAADPLDLAHIQVAAVYAVTSTGDIDRGEVIARSINDPGLQAEALGVVASAASAAGDLDRARAIADRIEALARSIAPGEPAAAQALSVAAHAVARTQDLERAEAIAESITDFQRQAETMSILAMSIPKGAVLRLVGRAIKVGGWRPCLTALAELQPSAVAAVADELVRLLDLRVRAQDHAAAAGRHVSQEPAS